MKKVLASLVLGGALIVATAASACEYGNQASTSSQSADKTAQTQSQPASSND